MNRMTCHANATLVANNEGRFTVMKLADQVCADHFKTLNFMCFLILLYLKFNILKEKTQHFWLNYNISAAL